MDVYIEMLSSAPVASWDRTDAELVAASVEIPPCPAFDDNVVANALALAYELKTIRHAVMRAFSNFVAPYFRKNHPIYKSMCFLYENSGLRSKLESILYLHVREDIDITAHFTNFESIFGPEKSCELTEVFYGQTFIYPELRTLRQRAGRPCKRPFPNSFPPVSVQHVASILARYTKALDMAEAYASQYGLEEDVKRETKAIRKRVHTVQMQAQQNALQNIDADYWNVC